MTANVNELKKGTKRMSHPKDRIIVVGRIADESSLDSGYLEHVDSSSRAIL